MVWVISGLMAAASSAAMVQPSVRSWLNLMKHLNLVMIHPFRDGNRRMTRALTTLVLTRSDIGEPEFSSIEEWLGANTNDYYSVLAHTGHGFWHPRADAHLWLTFNLRAHHMQAQTVARRVDEPGRRGPISTGYSRNTIFPDARWRQCSTPLSAIACAGRATSNAPKSPNRPPLVIQRP